MVWFFWVRLESMWYSKMQHGRRIENDPIMQEVMTMLSFDGSDEGNRQPGIDGDGQGPREEDRGLPHPVRLVEGEGGGGVRPRADRGAAALPHPRALHPPHPPGRHRQDKGGGGLRRVQAPHGEVRSLPLVQRLSRSSTASCHGLEEERRACVTETPRCSRGFSLPRGI
ncbi:hypothetical protein B296_00044205 [Ensete ventricosum]|uniref:Sieve element occlusion C-terminal domain-containing protein n=1 Tax=Ensete ventricosum TaxID=4639 RepID=A0A426Y6Y3_ENSVE|nr:hypothetical protein B296_00044205 [Ensete ventricosum]